MPEYSAGEEILFGYRGGSMWPLFQNGDVVVVKRVPLEQLRAGDCIAFRRPGQEQTTIHRIHRLKPDIRTRGDARPAADDEPVDPSWIEGRAEARIRYGHPTRLLGGLVGRWAGMFYSQVGKLNPSLGTRGGRAARQIQRLLRPAARLRLHRARVASFAVSDDRRRDYLIVGGRVVGAWDERGSAWLVAWPCRLCIDPALLPLSDRAPHQSRRV